jgi:uncharacterized membrane protein
MNILKVQSLPSSRMPISRILSALSFLYLALIAAISWQVWKKPIKGCYITGIIIGGIFVFVTVFYFFDNYVIPYINEQKKGKPHRQNIYFLMFEWFSPALLLQLFVVLGFIITIYYAPFSSGSIYTHPYQYGELYKNYEEAKAVEKKKGNLTLETKEKIANQYVGYFKTKTESQGESLSAIKIETKIQGIPYMIALSFGFLGALVYMLRDIAYRYFITDLYSKTLVGYLTRMIFAPVLCIVIAYFWMSNWSSSIAPMVFFFIGHFPQRGMQYIERNVSRVLNIKMPKKKEIPLELLEGMNDYIIYRFREIGIDDVQNLAFVDINYLNRNLGYGNRLLCDFISQAILLVYLKDHFEALQSFGIRDIISFQDIVTEENYKEIADILKINPEKLHGLLDILKKGIMSDRIGYLRTCILESEQEKLQT